MDRLKLLEESLAEYRHELEAGPASALQASSIYLINVMFETIDDMLAVAGAAREYAASGGNGGIERSFVDEQVFCGECFSNYVDNICAHEDFCAWGKLEAALAALEGDKQGEGEG